MSTYIMLNPCAKIINKSANGEMIISINNRVIRLKGSKIINYFNNHIEHFLFPCDIQEYMSEPQKNIWLKEDFILVMNKLYEEQIIVKFYDIESETKKLANRKFIVVNFTNNVLVRKLCQKLSKFDKPLVINGGDNLYREVELLCERNNLKKATCLMFYWRWENILHGNDYLEFSKYLINKEIDVLPIVLNNNYFSAGPLMQNETDIRNSIIGLENENNRYLYLSKFKNIMDFDCCLDIVASELNKTYSENKCRSLIFKQMLTYNFNSAEMHKRRYLDLIIQGE